MLKNCPWCALCLGATLALISPSSVVRGADAATKLPAIGTKVANQHALRDLRGNRRPLQDFTGRKAIVLAFLGTECPISNLYLPGLIRLEKQYRGQGVAFLGIYPNDHEDLDQIAMHTHDRDVPFLALKDCGQQLANGLGVTRVPTIVVLDGDFKLRYRGRMNDQYGAGSRRPQATREDLKLALDEVLGGKSVTCPGTEADGCLIEQAEKEPTKRAVTYAKEVSRILQNRCQTCHRPDQTGPFVLMSYEDAAKHGKMIKEVTTQRRMPPWQADPRYGHFINDRRLAKSEIETLAAWVDAGMPLGDEKDLPRAIEWPKGLAHAMADQVFTMPEEFTVPADGVLDLQRFVIPTDLTEDRWVRRADARPGSPSVVHHIGVYMLDDQMRSLSSPDGNLSMLADWAPGGAGGLDWPPDMAIRVPKGTRLLMELHYTPTGKITKDRSSVAVTFAKEAPKYELLFNVLANDSIKLPANDPHYRAEATLRLQADARIIGLAPHMHWRGKDFSYEVIYPDGRRETLLSVPRWDFNWQTHYNFKEPVRLPKGSKIHVVAHWDNSRYNLLNPAPDKTVLAGNQTQDEMMVGGIFYVWERPETAAELAKNPASLADLVFDRLDCNGDDLVTSNEVPDQWQTPLTQDGIKIPENMNREKFALWFVEMRKKMPLLVLNGFDGSPLLRSAEKKLPESEDALPKSLSIRQPLAMLVPSARERIVSPWQIGVLFLFIVSGAFMYKRWRRKTT